MILDLLIAAQMRPNPDLNYRLAALGVGQTTLRAALRSAERAGVIRRNVQPGDFIAHVGEPHRRGSDSLSYDLTMWPQHRFDFGIHHGGWLLYQGFVVKENLTSVPRPTLLSESTAKHAFRVGFHTSLHVNDTLGPARTRQGWDGMEDLFYTSDSGGDLAFEFDFGLLTGISRRSPVML